MMDFAAYLLHEEPHVSDEELLEQIESQLSEDAPPSLVDEMHEKLAGAYRAGIKLAHDQGMVVLENVVEKNAKIFGADRPHGLDRHAIPYDTRRSMYEDYAKQKSKEEPTGYAKGMLGGGGIGAGLGAGIGALAGHAGGGAAIGGGLGSLVGALLAHGDKKQITRAKGAVSGNLDRHLAEQIADDADQRDAVNYSHYKVRQLPLEHWQRSRRRRCLATGQPIGRRSLVARFAAGAALMGLARSVEPSWLEIETGQKQVFKGSHGYCPRRWGLCSWWWQRSSPCCGESQGSSDSWAESGCLRT
jgi:hypothetical protein